MEQLQYLAAGFVLTTVLGGAVGTFFRWRTWGYQHACAAATAEVAAQRTVTARLKDYDAVLHEWNDQLDSGLALVTTYFGLNARDWLDGEVYTGFQQVGGELEELYRLSRANAERELQREQVSHHLDLLNDRVYRLGAFMTTQLLGGEVGSNAPRPVAATASPDDVAGRRG